MRRCTPGRAASGPATATSHGTNRLIPRRRRRRKPRRGDPCGRPRRANAKRRCTQMGRHKGVPYIRPNSVQPASHPCCSLRVRAPAPGVETSMEQTGSSLDGVGDESRVGATLAVALAAQTQSGGAPGRDAARASPTAARTAPDGTSALFPVGPRPRPRSENCWRGVWRRYDWAVDRPRPRAIAAVAGDWFKV